MSLHEQHLSRQPDQSTNSFPKVFKSEAWRHLHKRITQIDPFMESALTRAPYLIPDVLEIRQAHLETYEHTLRVTELALPMARHVGMTDAASLHVLGTAALIHDRGKLHPSLLPLVKHEGPLTPDERKLLQAHPILAYQEYLSKDPNRPEIALVAGVHHQRTDGYPEDISVPESWSTIAGILNIADQIEAQLGERAYRHQPLPVGDVLATLLAKFQGPEDVLLREAAHFGVDSYWDRYYRLSSAV